MCVYVVCVCGGGGGGGGGGLVAFNRVLVILDTRILSPICIDFWKWIMVRQEVYTR